MFMREHLRAYVHGGVCACVIMRVCGCVCGCACVCVCVCVSVCKHEIERAKMCDEKVCLASLHNCSNSRH